MSLYAAFRPALFLLPPERAHRAAICALQTGLAPKSSFTHPSLATQVAGLSFPNPIGLAAGFDKNAECYTGALAAGFGHVEIGTVTPRAQPGNPTPRIFRLPEHKAVINRLGFNNRGLENAAWNLRHRSRAAGIIGGNIGKNKDSVEAVADYITAFSALYSRVDYITANISSPNTPGLRNLQAGDELRRLVQALHAERKALSTTNPSKPVFVKIAPDCDDGMLEAIAEIAIAENLDGLIVGNTTVTRDAVAGHAHAGETGGLSGAPLFALSTEVLRKTYQLTKGKIPLIGVGGVSSAEDAYEKIRGGASLVQLYTALVYEGFTLPDRINRGLVGLLARDGFKTVAEAVGTAN